jgi:pimeloyl-ACP methyl ester carboxylesterase
MPFARLSDDLDMYYEIDNFTDPWTKPETVVFHHGNCKGSHFWYRWVPIIARHYNVVRLDARGYGKSTVPAAGYKWSLQGFARDLEELLDHLRLDKVHLVGETVGGTISMLFASGHPARVRSLTVCSSPFRFTDPYYLDSARKAEKEGVLAWARDSMKRRLDPSRVGPEFVEWYANEMAKTPVRVVVDTHDALVGNDLSDVLRAIRVPTLLLSAESRPGYTEGYVREMERLIPGSKLVIFPGTFGFVHHSEPEKCAHTVLDFWRGIDPRGS